METIETLDVTLIEPRLKHPTIFKYYDQLSFGESMVIHNDHDPKPLYYQLLGERGNVFTWKYLLEGPTIWKVQIGKLAAGQKEATIGELVTKDMRKAEVFKKYGIDFCCGGKKTLTKVCREKGLDVVQIEKELMTVDEINVPASQNYNNWEIDFLADYIINTHHRYVRQSIPIILEYTQKVAKVHGSNHPEAVQIEASFFKIVDELNRHMMKEENVLFPYIENLVQAKKTQVKIATPSFGTIINPIKMMELEHIEVGDEAAIIQSLTNNFIPPADACNTYKLSFAKLKEFIEDLHQHIHLENNILFPKAIELEKELLSRAQ